MKQSNHSKGRRGFERDERENDRKGSRSLRACSDRKSNKYKLEFSPDLPDFEDFEDFEDLDGFEDLRDYDGYEELEDDDRFDDDQFDDDIEN